MTSLDQYFLWLILLLTNASTLALSLNPPNVSSNATWCTNATTFADQTTIGGPARALFIDRKDTIFVAAHQRNQILIWSKDSVTPTQTISASLSAFSPLFVTDENDIYFEHGSETGQINKWSMNSNQSAHVMTFSHHCFGLFIVNDNTLYCSLRWKHTVVKTSLDPNNTTETIVAGTGQQGDATNQLYRPWGIYVDKSMTLFVADAGNDRIQMFQPGQLNGTTVAGRGIPNNLQLNYPKDVILDGVGCMYIADSHSHRVIQVKQGAWRCLVGCSGKNGSAPDGLGNTYVVRFDSHGNLFVADEHNDRIQKFLLRTNSYGGQSSSFSPTVCPGDTGLGRYGNISSTPCSIVNPCLNNTTCINSDHTRYGFECSCTGGFFGEQCEIDRRVCRPGVCLNGGNCTVINNASECHCPPGREGSHCEKRTDLCRNVSCQNSGVCVSSFPNYSCICLGNNYYYGDHCEFQTTKLIFYRAFSKTCSYIAIVVMTATGMFIVIMDILKYCFGIDPAREDLEYIRRKKREKKRKPVIERFVYVDAPAQPLNTILEETTV